MNDHCRPPSCAFWRSDRPLLRIWLSLVGWIVATVLVSCSPAQTPPTPTPESSRRPNRLNHETSPYLRLHADNPVDWYPWGTEALEKARRENKLVFLSIGYSSCHWCHVMEHESFEDTEIARYLNDHYVCIKVDREERPDVDSIYMMAVQLLTRRGGWPLSVFLTPDAKPFFGATYFPARDTDRPGSTGFLTVIQRVQQVWDQQPDRVRQSAEQLTEAIRAELSGQLASDVPLDQNLVDRVFASLEETFDAQYGGFGYNPANPQQPKFPEPSNLLLLWDRAARSDDPRAKHMATMSLERMAMGGIRDHIGGGFHRYSTDRFWRIPHFEKMLYDNGQLLSVYSEAFRQTKRSEFGDVVRHTVQFLMRELRAPGGAFYSALCADSEGEEGTFYRWELTELEEQLGDQFPFAAQVFGFDGPANFEERYYVPQLSVPLEQVARQRHESLDDVAERLAIVREALRAARDKRPRPLTDTKILTAWNGMAIRGLADAGRILERPEWIQAAAQAAQFVIDHLRNDQGRLLRTYTEGEARLNAYLDDYACFVDGLIALYQATGEQKWLTHAVRLTELQIQLFWDEKHGGFLFTSRDHETLIAPVKEFADAAVPAGNSVAAENLLFLARAAGKTEYQGLAEQTLRAAVPLLDRAPAAAPRMTRAIARYLES